MWLFENSRVVKGGATSPTLNILISALSGLVKMRDGAFLEDPDAI